MKPKKTALAESMPPRVRNRREAKGISGADLSRRIGVSPAYVSQIEKGIRVPDIPVAVRIAHVLEDDEALYVAWCRDHKARSRSKTPSTGDEDAWTQLYRSDRFEDDALFSRAVQSGEDIPPSPSGKTVEVRSMREASPLVRSAPLFDSTEEPQGSVEKLVTSLSESARREGRSLVTAPVLEPGKDPGERDEVPRQLWVDTMVIDPRFLPDARLGRPFVFRADEEVSRRVRDRVAPGDLVDRLAGPGRRGAGAGQGVRDAEGREDIPGEAHELRGEVPRPAGARGQRDGRSRAGGGEAGEAGARG